MKRLNDPWQSGLLATLALLSACGALSACVSAGSSGTGGNSGSGGGSGGATAGMGGQSSSGAGGAAGAVGGNGAGGSAAGTGGTAGGGTGGATASGFCPTDHIFCADFEEASGLPPGAVLAAPDESNMAFGTAGFIELDTTSPFAGQKSLKVTSPGSFHFRMLGVPVPASFWVRLYIKSDQDIGQSDHNAFFEAMTDPDYHKNTGVELSEQFTCLLLNKSDTLFPTGTACGQATALPKNVWHCMVAQFDGTNGNVQVFVEQTRIINAVAWAPAKEAFTTFEFGYGNFNSPGATVWYDNVAIAAGPLSCP
jgi:polysaccharide lyase-like protein